MRICNFEIHRSLLIVIVLIAAALLWFGPGEIKEFEPDTAPAAAVQAETEEDGMLVEHWDTVDPVPPRSEWVNDNGKF